VSFVEDSGAYEIQALAAWNGHGAVQLLEADLERRAMLLERLASRRSLEDLPIAEAGPIAGQLLPRLAIPASKGLPLQINLARRIADDLIARWEQLQRPIPRTLVDAARDWAEQNGPSAGSLMVNWDLHYGNVLAGEREPWLAIDPKIVVGDPEFG